jgi:hypothetical protein
MSPRLTEKELLARLAELPREISPERDPWAQISARIEHGNDRTRQKSGWWSLAAAASVLLALAVGLFFRPGWREPVITPDSVAAVQQGTNSGGVPRIVHTADAEYVAAFREFMNTGRTDVGLSPQTIEKIEGGWADLLVTEKALTAALEQNPDDLFLNERMLELRARQLGFLKQLVALDRNNRRMTI